MLKTGRIWKRGQDGRMEDVQIVLTVDGFINVYKGKLDIDQGHEGQG